MALTPCVLDISHHQTLEPDAFVKMREAGIQGVIHKASEGTGWKDTTYAKRRKECESAGLLFGAYHFFTNASPEAQVENFLRIAKPTSDTLLALDWEDRFDKNGRRLPRPTVAQARRFLTVLMAKTGRRPDQIWVYTGHVGKEEIKSKDDRVFFAQFPLWLCHYTARDKPILPRAWSSYGLWQYSDKGHCAGIKAGGSVDLNVFGGKNLKAEWAAGPKPVAVEPEVVPASGKNPVAPKDLVPVSRKARGTSRFKTAWKGISITGLLTSLGMAQSTADQVGQIIKDHWLAILITFAILCIVFAKWIESLMAEDVNEGRAVPSGGLPG